MSERQSDALARLRRIEGQIRGLQKMLAEDRPYLDCITQFMAARAALDKVGIGLVSDHVRDCTQRRSAGAACEDELQRALALFLRMDWRPTGPEDEAEAESAPPVQAAEPAERGAG